MIAAGLVSACGDSGPPAGGAGTIPVGVGTVPTPVSIPGKCVASAATLQQQVTIPNLGVSLSPVGRLTAVGNLPIGGAVTPDGRQYWAVDSGFGLDDVKLVDIATGVVIQTLSLPGAYGGMVFSPNGNIAYVSGEPVGSGNATPPAGLMGTAGDVIHVYVRDPVSGLATEKTPIALPATTGGSGRTNGLPPTPNGPAWPIGLAITPDGKTLVAALNSADKAAIVTLDSTGTAAASSTTVSTGNYPYGAAIDRSGTYAYISNELDGTLTQIALGGNATTTISGLGGTVGDYGAHPQNLVTDPKADRLYVAVTDRDAVAILNSKTGALLKLVSLSRAEGVGAAPVALAVAPDGGTLYVADAGENAIVSIALSDRADGSHKAYDVIGKIPTADYPHDVQLTPDGCTTIWTAARGLGAGPNPGYLYFTFGPPSPYPSYVPTLLTGQVGILPTPADTYFAQSRAAVDAAVVPGSGNGLRPAIPAGSPVAAADGTASTKIKYVFYVVRENRTYDQIFGSDPRGNGQASLEMFDDNGAAAPVGGITPNAHALSRKYVLLDNFYEDSEVSVDGHVITSSAYAIDYVVKAIHANYSSRGKPYDFGIFPITYPPKGFLFDQALASGVTFRNYGEAAASILVAGNNRTTIQPQVVANTNASYPTDAEIGCTGTATGAPNAPQCVFDSGMGGAPALAMSRIDIFNRDFTAELAAGAVPHFNYLVMTNDHTQGVSASGRDPLAMVADNDLGVGQLVQLISQSSIWPQSVIFIVEDDSQDGPDHVDAHRAPAFVIGPYVKTGGQAIHTHYDQYSAIRTIELILGMPALSMHDANATPMFDVFSNTPDLTPYTAIAPTQNIQALCPCAKVKSATVALSAALPWNTVDAVPQELADRILWKRVYGEDSIPPVPGPNASPAEAERARAALALYARYRGHPAQAREALEGLLAGGDPD